MSSEKFPKTDPHVACQECGTIVGGGTTKDPYSHLLVCLKAEGGSLARMREAAERSRSERGRRIIHILDVIDPVSAPA